MTDYEDESKNRWKAAVIDALVVDCIYRKEHEDDPRNALNELCAWEQKIALDPAVSSDARALIERGRKEASPAGGKWMPEEPSEAMQLDGYKALTQERHAIAELAYRIARQMGCSVESAEMAWISAWRSPARARACYGAILRVGVR